MTNTTMSSINKSHICANCNQTINDRYMLQALDKMWHEDCLKCACCDCRLGETGSTLYLKANLILCKRDYLRLFGMTGHCASCQRLIPAFDLVMRCGELVYHLNCFSCHECQQKFCVGDRYFLYNNQILCEDDHERTRKALLLSSSSSSSSSSSTTDSSLFSK